MLQQHKTYRTAVAVAVAVNTRLRQHGNRTLWYHHLKSPLSKFLSLSVCACMCMCLCLRFGPPLSFIFIARSNETVACLVFSLIYYVLADLLPDSKQS